ncbi:type 1 glutamine amidotransferase family protein [Gellertiella hungarica]|uniref:Putative intracellular protease/amidase n=1 Tax=Gellertiella hungarica TaxID=1572859 RepID=A0A7W6NJ92_9HYPH|nr:type 1 glutamine amidotransferase family protein [Gellertiella hungarica]MBB4063503.1 putative intracellular protease/amidase [Gellertiella hungarica]
MASLTLLLTENHADWETALLFAAARAHLGFEVRVATPGGHPVRSMGGLHITPDLDIGDLVPGDANALVLCGGTAWESPQAPALGDLLNRHHGAGTLIAAICGATVALARAGLLDAVNHTSNSRETLAPTGYRGAHLYRDQPMACRDGGIVTAPGTAPLTFAREILAGLGAASPELDGFLSLFAREMEALTR